MFSPYKRGNKDVMIFDKFRKYLIKFMNTFSGKSYIIIL